MKSQIPTAARSTGLYEESGRIGPCSESQLVMAKVPRSKSPAKSESKPPRQVRLRPEVRRSQVVREAWNFFAEKGFDGKLKDLAKRLGVTPPLLNRYFASKDELLTAIYQENYRDLWLPEGDSLLADRSLSVEERLGRFYEAYARQTSNFRHIRVLFILALQGFDFRTRYVRVLDKRLVMVVCQEIRHELGLARPNLPITPAEKQLITFLHGAMSHLSINQHLHGIRLRMPLDQVIRLQVQTFMAGARAVVPGLVENAQANLIAAE